MPLTNHQAISLAVSGLSLLRGRPLAEAFVVGFGTDRLMKILGWPQEQFLGDVAGIDPYTLAQWCAAYVRSTYSY